jgi:hypothetical protein
MYFARFSLLLLVVYCAHAEQQPSCVGISGTEQLWSRPGVRFIVVGEMHGTAETPAIFRDLVCSAVAAKRPVLVGVELRDQHEIDVFMRPGNDEAAVRNLLSAKEWTRSDGRSSRAMLTLLKELRAFKLKGLISGVVAFADTFPQESAAQGEKRMAAALQAAANKNPDALVIALVGNVHACKGTLPDVGPDPLMASFLPVAETVSLFVTDRGGEAWNCQGGGCGPHELGSSGGNERGITLSPAASPLPGYDGVLSTGHRATASSPAIGKQ